MNIVLVNLKEISELDGSKSFKWGLRYSFDPGSSSLNYKGSETLLAQNKLLGEMSAWLKQFQLLPCEVDIKISAEEHDLVLDGEINAYTQKALEEAQVFLSEIDILVYTFARRYPRSSFSMAYSQVITITEVLR